jgi:hypothetical protein
MGLHRIGVEADFAPPPSAMPNGAETTGKRLFQRLVGLLPALHQLFHLGPARCSREQRQLQIGPAEKFDPSV